MKIMKILLAALAFVLVPAGLFAARVQLDVSVSDPVLSANTRAKTYLKVGLTGVSFEEIRERVPVNVSLVIDRSGSMDGDKIRQAREAAKFAIDMLSEKDIISIVTYSDTVSILLPATKVSSKARLKSLIDDIQAGGGTALFAGVSKGAREARKFRKDDMVNRVILLSDGLANIGPDSPWELGRFGASLQKEGIAVTTIGLGTGYNEDLMFELAMKSDGNHAFVEHSNDLVRVFEYEFDDVLSVVAQKVSVEITCEQDITPLRLLGRSGDIAGNKVYTYLNQLYGNQEKYIMLEVDVVPGADGSMRDIAKVDVQYADMKSKQITHVSGWAGVRFSANENDVKGNIDKETKAEAVLQLATEENQRALKLRDEGKVAEAEDLLKSNAEMLEEEAAELESEELQEYADSNAEAADNLDEEKWARQRKSMKKEQYDNETQQSY